MAFSEPEELGKEVVVMSARPTVEHQEARGVSRSVLAPVKRYGRGRCVAFGVGIHLDGWEEAAKTKN